LLKNETNSMELKVLGKTKQLRGRLFEKFVTSVLEKMGYQDFKKNVIKEGMEFDIKATHKKTKIRILCECKAQNKPIGPKDVQNFLAKFISE
jgi:restriction endonuclease Mrr